MRFYWVRDRNKQGHFNVFWAPGRDNLGNCFTKHHPLSHHQLILPVFLHEKPTTETRFLQGCVNSHDHTKVPRKPQPHTWINTPVQQQTSYLNRRIQPDMKPMTTSNNNITLLP